MLSEIKPLKLGMIGLDTSHVVTFAKLLHDESNPHHVPGGRVTVAYPGGSPDFMFARVEGYTNQLSDEFGVQIADSMEQVAEESDAILLESVDGRVHPEQFRRIASYGKPVFVDKPFAVSSRDAIELFTLAERHGVALFSSSALRYAEPLVAAVADDRLGGVIGADACGAMALEPTQPGLFWYGIHTVEMLYAAMGPGCLHVTAATSEHHEFVMGQWQDGRIGTVRGNRKGNGTYGVAIHREKGSAFVNASAGARPYYVGLLENILATFRTGKPAVGKEVTLEIMRFIEAANESRETGRRVRL